MIQPMSEKHIWYIWSEISHILRAIVKNISMVTLVRLKNLVRLVFFILLICQKTFIAYYYCTSIWLGLFFFSFNLTVCLIFNK